MRILFIYNKYLFNFQFLCFRKLNAEDRENVKLRGMGARTPPLASHLQLVASSSSLFNDGCDGELVVLNGNGVECCFALSLFVPIMSLVKTNSKFLLYI